MNVYKLIRILAITCLLFPLSFTANAAPGESDYKLTVGDVIKIDVFQNPDLAVETAISDNGNISYPLIGQVKAEGLSSIELGEQIAKRLHEGRFVNKPHVSVVVQKKVGNFVSVLGQVNAPGRYVLDSTQLRLTDVLSMAGGINAEGGDKVIVSGVRDGKAFKASIDITQIFIDNETSLNIQIHKGDTLYVHRADVFYVYGQSQQPGAYRLERGMTVMQAIAKSGGITSKGTLSGVRIQTKNASGQLVEKEPSLTASVKPDDVIYIKESIF